MNLQSPHFMTVPIATDLFSFSRIIVSNGTTVCGKRLLLLFHRDIFAPLSIEFNLNFHLIGSFS